MVDFSQLRNRKTSNFEAMQKTLEKTKGGFQKDERIWKYGNVKGKSSSIIRFLPISKTDMQRVADGLNVDSDLSPMVFVIKHQFQGPTGKWYIENSLQTFGEACPVREHDGPLWKPAKDNKDEAAQKKLKARLPRTEYITNVYVEKDSVNPENEGKVFLFVFGEAIKKIIEKAGAPEFDTDVPFDPFDPFEEGRSLVLNLTFETRNFGGKDVDVPIFDAVKWTDPGALFGGDESKIKEVWEKSYSLLEFLDRKNFKTYEELQTKFNSVMGLNSDGLPIGTGASLGKGVESLIQETLESDPAPEPTKTAESKSKPTAVVSGEDADAISEMEKWLN